jgi:uncharacterized damage-inducible protein DinB
MTKEIERIEDQLKRSFEGEAWHGPSVLEILDGVTAEQAAARPLPAAHSIWEIVAHIAAWERACLRRLAGDRAQLPPEEDWPAVSDTREEAWDLIRAEAREGNKELRLGISRLQDERLDQPIIEGMPSIYATLHGVIQHDLYHAGQIAILKKGL